jgi:hypothetical protein
MAVRLGSRDPRPVDLQIEGSCGSAGRNNLAIKNEQVSRKGKAVNPAE